MKGTRYTTLYSTIISSEPKAAAGLEPARSYKRGEEEEIGYDYDTAMHATSTAYIQRDRHSNTVIHKKETHDSRQRSEQKQATDRQAQGKG